MVKRIFSNLDRSSYVFRIISNHQRLYISIAIGFAVSLLVSNVASLSKVTLSIIGYDSAAIIYIIWAIHLMYNSTAGQMQKRAIVQDDGKLVVLFLVVLALIFSICAIFANLSTVKHLEGSEKYANLILTLLTIAAS